MLLTPHIPSIQIQNMFRCLYLSYINNRTPLILNVNSFGDDLIGGDLSR